MRPTVRPDKPFTLQEIVDRVHQHFIVDNNPICMIDGGCAYAGTGCFIGCFLTLEDAKVLDVEDGESGGTSLTACLADSEKEEILSKYLDVKDRNLIAFLSGGQYRHDDGHMEEASGSCAARIQRYLIDKARIYDYDYPPSVVRNEEVES